MAVAVHINPQHMSREDYERVLPRRAETWLRCGLLQDAGINPGIVEVHPLHSAPPG